MGLTWFQQIPTLLFFSGNSCILLAYSLRDQFFGFAKQWIARVQLQPKFQCEDTDARPS